MNHNLSIWSSSTQNRVLVHYQYSGFYCGQIQKSIPYQLNYRLIKNPVSKIFSLFAKFSTKMAPKPNIETSCYCDSSYRNIDIENIELPTISNFQVSNSTLKQLSQTPTLKSKNLGTKQMWDFDSYLSVGWRSWMWYFVCGVDMNPKYCVAGETIICVAFFSYVWLFSSTPVT